MVVGDSDYMIDPDYVDWDAVHDIEQEWRSAEARAEGLLGRIDDTEGNVNRRVRRRCPDALFLIAQARRLVSRDMWVDEGVPSASFDHCADAVEASLSGLRVAIARVLADDAASLLDLTAERLAVSEDSAHPADHGPDPPPERIVASPLGAHAPPRPSTAPLEGARVGRLAA